MAHTPGPWRTLPEHGRIVLNGSAIYGVADITGDYANWNPDDLRLMAAAPDMLDALHASLDSLRWLTEWRTHDATACDQEIEHEIVRISKAIAKAEGRAD